MSTSSTHVFAQAEQEVYHACLEWPLWLALRMRQLERNLQLANAIDPTLTDQEEYTHVNQTDDR